MPVPIDRNRKSSTPRATPRHCSPRAARLMSFSSCTPTECVREPTGEPRALDAATFEASDTDPSTGSTTPGTPTTAPSRGALAWSTSSPQSEATVAIVDVEVVADERRRLDARVSFPREVAERRPDEAGADVHRERRAPPRAPARRRGRRSAAGSGRARSPARALGHAEPGGRATRSVSRCPSRRAISAREIGAPPRIASSTARSFRCLSSGGVARVVIE